MSEVSTMERVIRSDVSMEECKKIEKVLSLKDGSYIQDFLDFLIMIRMPNVIF